jgi:hypothetical protein
LTGIRIRVAETDADLEAWRRVRLAVLPNERCAPVEWMRASMTPERLAYVYGTESITVRAPLPLA